MGKKAKRQPNAPDLQQVLLGQQPPHNPYYPDLTQAAPPPYSDLVSSAPLVTSTAGHNSRDHQISYQLPMSNRPTVVVQQPGFSSVSVTRTFRDEHQKARVKNFNSNMVIMGFIVVLLSFWARDLYSRRQCVVDYVIHQPKPDITVHLSDLRNMHIPVAYLTALLVFFCGLKSCCGYYKENSCYLFIVLMTSIVGAFVTGYMVYLSYYSPCVASLNEIATKSAKTVLSELGFDVSRPDKGYFGETTIFRYIDQDGFGVVIFFTNVFNFMYYFYGAIRSLSLC